MNSSIATDNPSVAMAVIAVDRRKGESKCRFVGERKLKTQNGHPTNIFPTRWERVGAWLLIPTAKAMEVMKAHIANAMATKKITGFEGKVIKAVLVYRLCPIRWC